MRTLHTSRPTPQTCAVRHVEVTGSRNGGLREAWFGVRAPERVLHPGHPFDALEERGFTFVTTTQTHEVPLP